MKQLILFDKGIWNKFGRTIISYLYKPVTFRYNYGEGYKDVRTVARYFLDKNERRILKKIVEDNKLKGKTEKETVKKVMNWVNKTYPSSIYYKVDRREHWNKPSETLKSFEDRKKIVDQNPGRSKLYWRYINSDFKNYPITTDCDDYAILIYNLCAVAGVNTDNLYLCFMKTITEWHLNVMYFDGQTPYAVEGTYHPEIAMREFGKTPYFNLRSWSSGWVNYYRYVKYLFNNKKVLKNKDKINKLTL